MYSLRLREMVVNARRVPGPVGESSPCLPASRRHQRVSHYLAAAVTTTQRLMHAIVAASRPELPCFRRLAANAFIRMSGEYALMFRR